LALKLESNFVLDETRLGDRYESLVAEYRRGTPLSKALHEQARGVLPGGDTRTIAFHPPYPLAIDRGEGCHIWDLDGARYIDLLNNYTSLIHGHAHPGIVEAVTRRLGRGTAFAAAGAEQYQLARMLTERVAALDLVRFCNSGTEATMHAARAARAFTGRELLVKMEGGYHGSYDDFEVSVHPSERNAGEASSPRPTLDAAGVPANTTRNVCVLPFNDQEAAKMLFAARGDDIAAVIIEPVMGASGMIPADDAFLSQLRKLTEAHGALLIFDEVMTFRLAPGGYQGEVGIAPDLTTFAKIIGGGFPVGAFGGRAAIMEQYDPSAPTPMWQSGTFNGNAVTMAAGIAALDAFPAAEVAHINALGARLRAGLERLLERQRLVATVTGFGSFAAIHFSAGPIRNYRDTVRGSLSLRRALHVALLVEGVFCAPRLMFCTSTPMNESVIDESLQQIERAFERLVN